MEETAPFIKDTPANAIPWDCRARLLQVMVWNSQTAVLQEITKDSNLLEVLERSWVEEDVKRGLMQLFRFNRDLDRNAHLSRLNEKYLEERTEDLDAHCPVSVELYEHTRTRVHELLLICAANYANNCEYSAVGDLLFNPRLTLVHIRGHGPVAKERHQPLTEQFRNRGRKLTEVVRWLKEETTLQRKKQPLIPHSYEILGRCRFISKGYLDSARARAVQIADLSAFLSCRGFQDRLELDKWLRSATASDRALMESRLIRLDWSTFQELGSLIDLTISSLFAPLPFSPEPPD
jgi:hypothetical protein